MAEPKQKLSRARTRRRRYSKKVKLPDLVQCKKCQSWIPPHRVCPVCGTYRGKEILETKPKVKLEKKE